MHSIRRILNKLKSKIAFPGKWRAFNTVELLTVVGMTAVLATAGYQIFRLAVTTQARTKDFITAELLARDLVELTISKRNEDWNSLANGQYYFVEDPTDGFLFAAGEETIDYFTRSVTIADVNRDGSGDIVASGGNLDEDVKSVTATVEWTYRDRNFLVEIVQYLTNWRRF
jgi:hypothetical protein